jgi:hypothetical protein
MSIKPLSVTVFHLPPVADIRFQQIQKFEFNTGVSTIKSKAIAVQINKYFIGQVWPDLTVRKSERQIDEKPVSISPFVLS